MLVSLNIRNYVLIDSLEIDFPGGLVIISGPTGAGKSIIIGALGLLTGAKADASVIGARGENCVVEGEFEFRDKALEEFCRENDLDYSDGHLIIRRMVASSGRSRAFVNDEPVTVGVLEGLGHLLLDVHSQHETMLLTDRKYQLGVLDAFAGNSALQEKCADAFAKMRGISAEMETLRSRITAARNEADYNRSIFEQLDKAMLHEGEIAELEQEQYQLANSEQIKELLTACVTAFEGSAETDSDGVGSALVSLHRNLSKLAAFIPESEEWAQRLESARIEIRDIADSLADADQRFSCDPERLQWVDDRLSLLYGLLKRHDCADEAQLIAKRDLLKNLVFGMEDAEQELAALEKSYSAAKADFEAVCADLHEARAAAAPRFATLIRENLSFMELDKAAFEVELSPCTPGPNGGDEVAYMFNATGGRLAPVAKCASGGELSRIMLSLKQQMSTFMNMPTMIFDEIDTGVSGSVADKMGSVICTMGSSMQVFAITHLPQVAAKGDAHYLVQKTAEGDATTSTIKKLSEDQRVLELARMLSGSSLSPEAIANAKALLKK